MKKSILELKTRIKQELVFKKFYKKFLKTKKNANISLRFFKRRYRYVLK